MNWIDKFSIEDKPEIKDIDNYVDSHLWNDLCEFIECTYKINPKIEYSKCSGSPGWNVKYKKSNKSLCTLYPHKNYYTSLVCIGTKESSEAELMLASMSEYVQKLYNSVKLFNNSRWLMIDITTEEILDDVKKLVLIRVKPPKKI